MDQDQNDLEGELTRLFAELELEIEAIKTVIEPARRAGWLASPPNPAEAELEAASAPLLERQAASS